MSSKGLLLLDSCEHLIEKNAEVADRIFQFAPDIHVLATSREALQTGGEHVFRLPSLDCPPEQLQTAAEVLSYPAARLFVERVRARGNDFPLSNDEAPLVAEICRKLDGPIYGQFTEGFRTPDLVLAKEMLSRKIHAA